MNRALIWMVMAAILAGAAFGAAESAPGRAGLAAEAPLDG